MRQFDLLSQETTYPGKHLHTETVMLRNEASPHTLTGERNISLRTWFQTSHQLSSPINIRGDPSCVRMTKAFRSREHIPPFYIF